MNRTLITYTLLLLSGLLSAAASPASGSLENRPLNQLEQRLKDIDAELSRLAEPTLRNGVGSLGWLSRTRKNKPLEEWVKIQLGGETLIDQVVLAPILTRDPTLGPQADGFPREFNVIAGTESDPEGIVVARFTAKNQLLPRIAPVVISIPPTTASWVKIEATVLSKRALDDAFIFQLSEVMVLSGPHNVALHKPLSVSSSRNAEDPCRQKEALVDGFTPYLIDAAGGEKSDPFVVIFGKKQTMVLVIDLEEARALNRIHLHTADFKEDIPSSYHADYGLPKHMLIEGASQPDFSDAVPLLDYRRETIYEAGPVIARRLSETTCRYVRLTALEAYSDPALPFNNLGFAEIELFAGDENVALGKTTQLQGRPTFTNGSLSALTDGRNYYGNLLPVREWMQQLASRHDLETERPVIASELARRYERQKTHLLRMKWLAALLVAGIALAVLIERFIHLRQLSRIKERFAADLHDELGANLHTIGLLSDMAEEAKESPDELSDHLRDIRSVTERTGSAVRNLTDLHESDELFTGLKEDMQHAAERVVDQLEHDLKIEGEQYLPRFKPRTRIDLFLFYKECLINICRHSGATQLSTHLAVTPKKICLTVTDNGSGMPDSVNNGIPRSLKRRAKLLKAKLSVVCPETGGTRITLRLNHRRFGC